MSRAGPIGAPVALRQPTTTSTSGLLRRKCACENKASSGASCKSCENETLRRRATGSAAPEIPVPDSVRQVLRSPGEPLDSATRDFMASRFGHAFAGVRIHADAAAARSAESVGALAYTVGRHIAFARDQFVPRSASGRELLAHELAHTLQQPRMPDLERLRIGAAEAAEEKAADRAADIALAGRGSLEPPAAAPALLRRKPDKAGGADAGVVKVVPDKSSGKLRVILVDANGRILAGLAEITPPRGEALDAAKISALTMQAEQDQFPSVTIMTPAKYSATINPAQDVTVAEDPGEEGAFHVTDITRAELESKWREVAQFSKDTTFYFNHLLAPGTAHQWDVEYWGTKADLQNVLDTDIYKKWLQGRAIKRARAAVHAQNRQYQQLLGDEFAFSGAAAREVIDYYHGPSTEERFGKGSGATYVKEVRDPDTGMVVASAEIHLWGGSSSVYVRDLNGKLIGGHEAPVVAVYGPQDYLLDPLGIQDMLGIAEADDRISLVTDVATGGVKFVARQGTKAGKVLVNAGVEAVSGEAKVASRASTEVLGSGATKKLVVRSEDVAEAVAHQSAKGPVSQAALKPSAAAAPAKTGPAKAATAAPASAQPSGKLAASGTAATPAPPRAKPKAKNDQALKSLKPQPAKPAATGKGGATGKAGKSGPDVANPAVAGEKKVLEQAVPISGYPTPARQRLATALQEEQMNATRPRSVGAAAKDANAPKPLPARRPPSKPAQKAESPVAEKGSTPEKSTVGPDAPKPKAVEKPRTPEDEFADFEKMLAEEFGAKGPITSDKLLQLYRHGSRPTVVKYLKLDLKKQAAAKGVMTVGDMSMKVKPGVALDKQVDDFVKSLEGAHSTPQSVGKKLPKDVQKALPEGKYNPDDALVTLTEKPTHTFMDQPWKDAFNNIRKQGKKEATGQWVFDEIAKGISKTPGMSASEKASRIARLHDEMFVELGLESGRKYPVPRIFSWREILAFKAKGKIGEP